VRGADPPARNPDSKPRDDRLAGEDATYPHTSQDRRCKPLNLIEPFPSAAMEISGEYVLACDQRTAWERLHDAQTLERCIPGCERVEWLDSETVEASLLLRVGTVRRRYTGRVRIADSTPWESYTLLIGETNRGSSVVSRIRLAPRDGKTAVCYDVQAQLDGYLARLGAPVAIAIARRVAARFFERLENEIRDDGDSAVAERVHAENGN
jgi:uncharacterized protein